MAKPNSRTTLFRRALVKLIEPFPDAGESWCMDCVLNDGKTLLLSVDGIVPHLEQHGPDDYVAVRGRRMGHKTITPF